jgi:hypothetical protein
MGRVLELLRRAERVLATDDLSQNWSDGRGIHLARELLGSAVEVNQNVSVYQLASLEETCDIIMFFCVYYHLLDPFYAFAQLRRCCHPGSLLLVDGPFTMALGPGEALHRFHDHDCEWLPSLEALQQIVHATYFSDVDRVFQEAFAPVGNGERVPPITNVNRLFMTCIPIEAAVSLFVYPPPFGLSDYDPRFRQTGAEDHPIAKPTSQSFGSHDGSAALGSRLGTGRVEEWRGCLGLA